MQGLTGFHLFTSSRHLLPVLLLPALCSGISACGPADKFPLPDEFDAAFVTGSVCLPSSIRTGTAAPASPAFDYPVRFETCIYRCVELDRSSVVFRNSWTCLGAQCDMMLLLTGHVHRVDGEQDCDARDLVAPSASECTPQTFDVFADPPHTDMGSGDMYFTGDFRVSVPFLDLDQSQAVLEQINAGQSPLVAAQSAGVQTAPDRQFVINFDPAHAAVTSHDALSASDCHRIVAP